MNETQTLGARLALWGCLLVVVLTMALDAAVGATPWETRDSQGRGMGFNDRFSAEHYRIAFGNLRPWHFFKPVYAYEWLECGMIAWGIRLLGRSSGIRPRVWRFFLLQSAVFLFGWPGWVFFLWPLEVVALLRLELDRESFVDLPFTWLAAQPPWVLTSAVVAGILYSRSRLHLDANPVLEPAPPLV
jgi:hypothetical protein